MIKEATINEIRMIRTFVRKVYDRFLSCHHSKEGNKQFYEFIEYSQFLKRMNTAESKIFYKTNRLGMIIGVIELRYGSHISLLYVHENYQRKGIAKELFAFVKLQNCTQKYTVNSSIYAVTIYRKMGFVAQVKKIQKTSGVQYLPMVYIENITNSKITNIND